MGGRPSSERSCCSALHREAVLHLSLHYTLQAADELAQQSMLDRAGQAAMTMRSELMHPSLALTL
jgi:hypothetical protein